MAFDDRDRQLLLAVKGVGPTVLRRLEQMGIDDLAALAIQDAGAICVAASGLVGSTCWKNSPQARAAIDAAIRAAREEVTARA